MNKYIMGSILSAISLLVIFGASASNRVANWIDHPTTQRQPAATGSNLVSINSTSPETQPPNTGTGTGTGTGTEQGNSQDNRPSSQVNSNLTPLQQAGELPQRQTFVDSDTTGNQQISQTPTTQPATTQPDTTQPATTQPTPTPTPVPTAPATTSEPIRALW